MNTTAEKELLTMNSCDQKGISKHMQELRQSLETHDPLDKSTGYYLKALVSILVFSDFCRFFSMYYMAKVKSWKRRL